MLEAMEEYANQFKKGDVVKGVCEHPYEYLSFGEDAYCECEKCNTRLS